MQIARLRRQRQRPASTRRRKRREEERRRRKRRRRRRRERGRRGERGEGFRRKGERRWRGAGEPGWREGRTRERWAARRTRIAAPARRILSTHRTRMSSTHTARRARSRCLWTAAHAKRRATARCDTETRENKKRRGQYRVKYTTGHSSAPRLHARRRRPWVVRKHTLSPRTWRRANRYTRSYNSLQRNGLFARTPARSGAPGTLLTTTKWVPSRTRLTTETNTGGALAPPNAPTRQQLQLLQTSSTPPLLLLHPSLAVLSSEDLALALCERGAGGGL
eukprot:562058-Rhodomonas_salina.1